MSNHKRTFPWITVALVATNLCVWLVAIESQAPRQAAEFIVDYSFAPIRLTAAENGQATATELARTASSMFVHEPGMDHIGFNMLFLVAFGIALESKLGRSKYLAIYFLAGIGTCGLYWLIAPDGLLMLGASAAVCGVLGAYIAMFWNDASLLRRLSITVPLLLLGLTVYRAINITADSPAGFMDWAHLSGFIVGALVAGLSTVGKPKANTATG